MLKVFHYRLYPTKAQKKELNKTLELCRWTYNETLAIRKNAWESEQKRISYYDSKKMIPIWKKDKPELKEVHSQVLQEVVKRVDLAFQAFFRRVKSGEKPGYPRFKGYDRYDSITYTQSGFSLDFNMLSLSKIGDIKIKLHRPVEGEIKRLNVRKMPTGKWFASFLVETELPLILQKTGLSIGVDVGISSFLTLSDGQHVPNPRFFVNEEKNLAKAQRKLSKAEKGTALRKKALKVVQHVHERITNKRNDFAQKVSLNLVKAYDLITFEDLNVKGMIQNHCLAKHIADVAWNQLITLTTYKAEWAGKHVELVNPYNTSQMCSGCGQIVQKDLSERIHNCPFCGLILDRDHNAAINILRLGLQSLRIPDRCPSFQ
ncbi:Mobile element protein [Methanosarcina lacustris Z-7289]|uniref:Mobile element protein n=1 Tax=Methanosarcina lacustris Z-7289 TaxID=1434111 RepID=A0A0E3S9G4_9EURY|nr:RNA-guided endonuclease TnpB family protein [Methanosarcina lacustris]AKB76247.1 Mobile element protein [Methanosarcina lacustris Z-7289]